MSERADTAAEAPGYTLWQLMLYMPELGTWGSGGPVALVGYMHRDLGRRPLRGVVGPDPCARVRTFGILRQVPVAGRRGTLRRRTPMSDPVSALVLDLLEWIGPEPRPYSEVMEAWRTSCPRLPVWEEANTLGFLTHSRREGIGSVVGVSPAGLAHLVAQRSRLRFAQCIPS